MTSSLQLDHQAHTPKGSKYPLCLLASDIHIAMNVGSLFRLADALGLEKIYLAGDSIIPPNDKLRKAARATEKYVAYAYEQSALDCALRLKNAGYKIISLEMTRNSVDLQHLQLAPEDKVCLIIGAENHGVDQALLSISDAVAHIPMRGENSSMNLVSACAIAAYTLTQQLETVEASAS